jgi:hypothetical protein
MTPYRFAFVKRDGTGRELAALRSSLFNQFIGGAGTIFRLKEGRQRVAAKRECNCLAPSERGEVPAFTTTVGNYPAE